ncbi:cytochrome c oxidase assembly protein COX19 isoform X2 [Vulpes lagopus]|uniref:cytochrome c oxidase assembly protein COX19 isoform X2 n=1 Tax=Vulpes lagopus TaxID=494514 RepID=UPI000DF71D5E|nr:cytochrome c oxidase assembly protein COX19 isoform X2 [Vulpes vulpes]XP_041605785.1 cytochrome c oxidase assembly protein COX19 isoform X2 [Vulpes lagopus]
MSTAMNFGSKTFQPRPPDKGSFPLDHFGECKSFKEKFMKCLRDNKFENALCRKESKAYLECRMERIPVMMLCPGNVTLRIGQFAAVVPALARFPLYHGGPQSQAPAMRVSSADHSEV